MIHMFKFNIKYNFQNIIKNDILMIQSFIFIKYLQILIENYNYENYESYV
jgi:hypothetical protein